LDLVLIDFETLILMETKSYVRFPGYTMFEALSEGGFLSWTKHNSAGSIIVEILLASFFLKNAPSWRQVFYFATLFFFKKCPQLAANQMFLAFLMCFIITYPSNWQFI